MRIYKIALLSIFLTLISIIVDAQVISLSKSDLIIESISINQFYLDSKDRLGMPLMNQYKKLEVQVAIKNISDVEFNGVLYLARTNSNDDLKLNLFSISERIAEESLNILPKEVKRFYFEYYVDRELKGMKFKINETSDIKKIHPEEDYFNNVFTVKL